MKLKKFIPLSLVASAGLAIAKNKKVAEKVVNETTFIQSNKIVMLIVLGLIAASGVGYYVWTIQQKKTK